MFPIPQRNSFGKESVVYWENFLSDYDLHYLSNVKEWHSLRDAGVGGVGAPVINKQVRETGVGWLSPTEENRHIWEKISNTFAEVNRRFFRFDLSGLYEPMQLGLYHFGNQGHYDWHVDAGEKDCCVPRKLSMALMLSDPSTFTGGDLEVKPATNETITLEQKRGRAWFFPSYVLHRVTPVTSGYRQSLVLWAGGPEFK